MFVFWYCHKRGREVRLAAEGRATVVDSEGRIVELPDDPQLEDRAHSDRERHGHRSRNHELRSSRDRNRIEDEIPVEASGSRHSHGNGSRRHSPHGSRRSKESQRSKRSHREREERRRGGDRDETPYERSDKVCYQNYD